MIFEAVRGTGRRTGRGIGSAVGVAVVGRAEGRAFMGDTRIGLDVTELDEWIWGVEGAVSCRARGTSNGSAVGKLEKRSASGKSSRAGPSSADGSSRGARAGVLRAAGEGEGDAADTGALAGRVGGSKGVLPCRITR